jgi:membrane peptidoglycan carboxypeptidase
LYLRRGVRNGRPVALLLGACLLAGVVVAGLLSPVVIGAGVLSNQGDGSVDDAAANADTSQLTSTRMPQVTTVLDRTGAPLAKLFAQYRLPVTYQQISTAMDAAIIALEDRRFFQDAGVDPRAVLGAALTSAPVS